MNVDIKENKIEKLIKLPHLGQRILKTGIAVFFCCLIYMSRGYQGMVSQSAVAAIICMQPFKEDSINASIERITGTLIGAFWGLSFLWIMKRYPILSIHMSLVYFLMACGVIITLYSTVVVKKAETAGLAAIVFLSIVIMYPNLESPLLQTVDRFVDTLIGIVVAGIINSFSLPREKHREYVFFVRLQDLVPDRYSHVSPRVHVMLNRLFNEGANICLVSRWAPAFLLCQMGTMNVNIPLIVMDGAAQYDVNDKQYRNIIPIQPGDVEYLCQRLKKMGLGYCVYAVQNGSMLIYREGNLNRAEEQEYELMKRSPYRNYIHGEHHTGDQIAFIRTIGMDDYIDEVEEGLRDLIMEDRFRIVRRPQPRMEGYSGLYFYDKNATVEAQKEDIMVYMRKMEEKGIVPVEMRIRDQIANERESFHLLNKVRKIYEPVSWR